MRSYIGWMRTPTLLRTSGISAALLLAAVVAAPSAIGGGGPTIAASGTSFSPATVKVDQGTQVTWSFSGTHTSTSNQGFWESGSQSGGSFAQTLRSAGRFPYHCTFHVASGMKGTIIVPLKADGAPSTGWTLRWSSGPAPAGRAFDVQYRRQGTSTWHDLRVNTTGATALYNPAQAGTYELRARTSNTAAHKESGWSPTISRQIT